MLRPEDPWFVGDETEDADELLKVLPEIRLYMDPPPDSDIGLRTLLEQPEQLAHPWWRNQASKSGRNSMTRTRHRAA